MTEVKAVAFHEAGHAVVAMRLGSKVRVVETEPRPRTLCAHRTEAPQEYGAEGDALAIEETAEAESSLEDRGIGIQFSKLLFKFLETINFFLHYFFFFFRERFFRPANLLRNLLIYR